MQKLAGFFFFPLLLSAAEHFVPIGSSGNRLLFTVQNFSSFTLQTCLVKIVSSPEWMKFESDIAQLDSIPDSGEGNVEFIFKVSEGEEGRQGIVELSVEDQKGQILARKLLVFRTKLESRETKLLPAYPNPTNSSVTIPFTLVESSEIRLDICNVLGQTVRTLYYGEKPAGFWSLVWDGKDDNGTDVSSGLYFGRLVVQNTYRSSIKIIIQR